MPVSNVVCQQALPQQRPVAQIKGQCSDWRVNEQLDIEFSGDGEHAYLYIEKENLNTLDVAKMLANRFEISLQDIGYAGLKDKRAITRQWFSLPISEARLAETGSNLITSEIEQASIRCLAVERHLRKLRRGQHSLNWFEIVLRDVVGLNADQKKHLGDAFPNRFGVQRLSTSNVSQALAWLAKGQTRVRRTRGKRGNNSARGWHMSVLRSLLFNAVLEHRVALNNFSDVLPGDVLLDESPTGPLWGRGRSAASLLAAELETEALKPHQATCAALEYTGLEHERRKLVETPQSFSVEALDEANSQLLLKFALPPGAYATSLLANTFLLADTLDVVTDNQSSERGSAAGE